MKIDNFILENWLNPACDSEKNKVYLGGSCVLPMTVEELFDLTGENLEEFLEELKKMNLGYPGLMEHLGVKQLLPIPIKKLNHRR